MHELDERQRSGADLYGEIVGSEELRDKFVERAQGEGFGAEIWRMAASSCFHDAWRDPRLARRDKSLALIATRQPNELKMHVKIGLRNGLTVREIEGILVQLLPYVGMPAMAAAIFPVREALREAGHDDAL